MKISVIVAHPDRRSLNCAIAKEAARALKGLGHKLFFHDLYRENFDPVMPAAEMKKRAKPSGIIGKHCAEISEAEGIVIVHPNWWGQPPAMLKGWIDRVLRQGVAYKFMEGDNGEGVPVGLLKIKKAVVFNTSDTPQEREKAVFGDPLEGLWEKCIFGLCGSGKFCRRNYGVVVTSTAGERKRWLADAGETVKKAFPGN